MKEYLVTTIDNPFNPFTQYEEWNRYDEDHGYYTNEYLARVAVTSHELSDEANTREINRAVDEICRLNILGIYRKVDAEGNYYGVPVDYEPVFGSTPVVEDELAAPLPGVREGD